MSFPTRTSFIALLIPLAALLSLASCSKDKEEPKDQALRSTPEAVEVMTATATGTVQSVDAVKRTVTLQTPDGIKTYKCGKDVINFDQIKSGDIVKATVVEKIALFVEPSGTPSAGSAGVIALAPKGWMPGGVMAETTEVSDLITAVDPAAHTVTLQSVAGPPQTFHVAPSVDLSAVKKGDSVTVRYTDGIALSVEAPQAAAQTAAERAK